MNPISPSQVALVERSMSLVSDDRVRFSKRFYARLFKLAPETRSMFPDDMTEQREKLVDELVFLAHAAPDLDRFSDEAVRLGMHHRGLGVTTEHYEVLEKVLLGTLGEVAGVAWSDELRDAWSALYRAVATIMQNEVVDR